MIKMNFSFHAISTDSKLPLKEQKEKASPPRIQIRAILIRCPQHIIPDNVGGAGVKPKDDKVISVLRTDDIMRFSGFDKDELLMHSEVKNCKRKMIITMMINNFGRTVTEEEFVVVDHVYDPDLHKRSRLLNPFVFKIKQDAVLQLYGMRYIQSVNAMAREEIINKGLSNFTGCDTSSSHPTCGMVYHNNRIVPFSEGFCCSCDSYVNLQRQPGLSISRQQKSFSEFNRKRNNFVEKNDFGDDDKYSEKFKRDVNEHSWKQADSLDVLRSKYMSSDFDFARNGFYTPQIVRRNSLSDVSKEATSEEGSSWERKSRFDDVVDKGNPILWNDNLERIPNVNEEELGNKDGGKKKRRSADGEREESSSGRENEISDEYCAKKKNKEVDGESKQGLSDVEEEIVDKDGEKKKRRDVDSEHEQSLNGDEEEISDKGEHSVHDEHESLRNNGMRVTEEKPFLLKPKDWSSLKALKLRAKGLKPVSPQLGNAYQPSHRYVKVLDEKPFMENAKGFQMSDYRPRWNSNKRIPNKKPTPWEIIPRKCTTDQRKTSILRVLTHLNEERCHPDPVYDNVEDSKLFDNLMKNIERKLVRNSRSSVSETKQSHTNNSLLYDDSIRNTDKNTCEEAWNELQTLLLEQAIDEKLCLDEKKTTNEYDIIYNKEDAKIIDRLKRHINHWFDDNYEIDLPNIYNSNSSYRNDGETLQPTNTDDNPYFMNSAQNLKSSNRLSRYSFNNLKNRGEVVGHENHQSVFDGSRKFSGLEDFDFSSENKDNTNYLYQFGRRNRNSLGLEPYSRVGNLKPVINNEFNENLVSNLDVQSRIYDQNKKPWKKSENENVALKYPELPLEENIDGGIYRTDLNNDNHKMNNVAEGVSGLDKFHSNPPIHFHGDAGPVSVDEIKYGPLLETNSHSMKLSQAIPNSNSPLPNDLNSIHPLVIDETRSDCQSKVLDNSLQDQKIVSAVRSELNEENHDKLEKMLDENAQKMNDYNVERAENSINLSGGVWNSKEKDNLGLQHHAMIDNRNSLFIDDKSKPNLEKFDDFSNFNFGSSVNQNVEDDVGLRNKLGVESRGVILDGNFGKVDDQNADRISDNVGMMSDEMPISSNLSFEGSHLSRGNNLSHKSYHIYKQEMESPYIINTSHAKHRPNYQILKSNEEDDNKRSHYSEVASDFGSPSILKTSEVQNVMKNALNSRSENTSQFSVQDGSRPMASKSAPILISGNVGNINGQKGKLIFIPDETEEPITPKKQPNSEDYKRNYLENLKPYNVNSVLYSPESESNHLSYPNFTNSETCILGRAGYGITNFGGKNVNQKVSPSFWAGNRGRNFLETSLPIEQKSGSFINSHDAQLNYLQRNKENECNHSPRSNTNLNIDDINRPINTEDKFNSNADAPSRVPKNILNEYDLRDDKKSVVEKDKIEKRDTEQLKLRLKKNTKKVRRQVSSNGNQIRGGQNCIDRYVPSGANPISYHESAHCLRFSELWYSVYTLRKPNLDHSLHLQLYEKNNYPHATHWEELTRGITTDLGSGNRHIEDGMSTLSFTYIPLTDLMSGEYCLDEHRATLLVPESLPPDVAAKYPQLSGTPNEYLLVQSDDISLEGDECNKVGTSFEGFATQPDRCAQPRGTCLHNQPIDMWTHDIMARDEGRPGKFFLENYAVVAEQPLLVNHSSQEQSLALEYYKQFSTIIEVEVRSDLNAIVRTGESGQLSEIYVDSSCHSSTKLIVIVTNQGLASSAYYPKLSNCPIELPEVWTQNVGPLIVIAPQHRHMFQMTLYGELPVDRFHCSVELMNDKKELVATRRVRIQKHDRCICVWHCLCACTASTEGLSCEVMSMSHYHAAGFQGSLPVINLHPETRSGKLLKILMPIAIVVGFSLLLGLIKAVLGLCFTIVGVYGLWAVCKSKSKNLSAYLEDDLEDFEVEHDVQGYAVHPTQQTRNIKLHNKVAEFFINVFFVFLLLWELIAFLLCCACKSEEDYEENKDVDDESIQTSESEIETNDLEDESVTVNSVIEERRRCEEDIKGYNVEESNQCLIFVKNPEAKK